MARLSYPVDHDACGVGFVAQLGSTGSHEVVERALEALRRLTHRGGADADGRSGDGAGLLTAIPQSFFRGCASEAGIELPGEFAVGMVFLPSVRLRSARTVIENLAKSRGLQFLGWRKVPTNPSIAGPRSRDTLPVIEQCFFAPGKGEEDFEEQLFRLRKEADYKAPAGTYFCSLSSRTVVYKGLLTPDQLVAFYPDLSASDFESSFAIFHQRYSTNTRPSWSLAQPFRFVAHNGEINTISANRRWLRAKEGNLLRELSLPARLQLLEEGVSDSASFDNAMEILMRRGYNPAAAMLCMVPPAWENDSHIHPQLRSFLEAHAPAHEPWDGPAALIFTDGLTVGAKLDRNGLRPLRYTLTSDGLLVVGSEVGIADLYDKTVIERQRLGPGEMLLTEPIEGRILRPRELPGLGKWRSLMSSTPRTRMHPSACATPKSDADSKRALAALGWSDDHYRLLFQPLVHNGQEAVWSMGDDAPPAFLSCQQRPLWDHCKQRFAQVTNPPIDPLREAHVMSLDTYLGEEIVISSPVIDSGQLAELESSLQSVQRLDFTFPAGDGIEGATRALEQLEATAERLSAGQTGLVLLNDRGVDNTRAALPALLALAAVWVSLQRKGVWDIPVVIETGQVIDTHHVALLIASGASAIFPYAAMEQAASLKPDGATKYRLAVEQGLRKVMARMGISTLASYRNSQLFETIGLDADLCARFFEDAGRALSGKGLNDILQDCLDRHATAFDTGPAELRDRGLYRFRHNGERHANSPELVRRMHRFIQLPSKENYQAFSALAETRETVAIRDLLEIVPGMPVPAAEVESEASVLSRFSTQAMSLGAVSPEVHRTLAIAMNRLGGRSNTGEGGEIGMYIANPSKPIVASNKWPRRVSA